MTDDPSRYAPPLELRIPLSTIVDPSDGPAVAANPFVGEPPLPSALTTGPGISTAAATPLAAPTLPDLTDPTQVALLMARMFGEHLTGASIVPVPNAEQTMSGIGVPGQAATPGIAASPVAHPSTPGGEALPAMPTSSSTDVMGISLAPGQIEVPTSSGLPQSPLMGGGAPSLASGGTSLPSSGTLAGGSADPTAPASLAVPSDAFAPTGVTSESPFSVAPSSPAVWGDPGSAPSTIGTGVHDEMDYRHGGADSGGSPMYGAPPDLDAFLAIAPTAQGLPSFTVPVLDAPTSVVTPTAASGNLGAWTPGPAELPTSAPSTPADLTVHGAHADPHAWQGLPTSPTGDHALPSTMPDGARAGQMPSSGRTPSSPMGSPEVPSAGMVPSSSPFGAPIDLGGMIAHPQHAMGVPTINEPSSSPYHILGGDESRGLRELGRVVFDPYSVRKDFPILDEKVHGGKRLVWLDNAATTQKPRQVIERILYFYEHENSNVHRAAHTLAARSTDAFERARESARRLLNAPSTKEIVWVRGATEGINLVAKTWGKKYIGKGDEIVVTHLEHHANIVPWQMLCADVGAKLRVAPVDDRGDVILEQYERLMGPRTKLVSIPHVSNALGTITPTKQMVEIAHRYGAHVMVDGAQAVSHMKVDVQDLGCEWYVFSGHKVFAPTGIGVVWGKASVLDATPPWQGGGNMIEDVTFEHTKFHPPPWRFEAGTGSIGDAVGLGAAIEYVERIGMDVIDRYEHELLVYATQRLATVPGLRMIGTSAHKAGVMSFVLDGQRTEDVSAILDKDGIAVRSGHHCAQPILRRFGLEATVRASLAFYNVCEDIDALVESLHRLQAGRG
ncbi:MAG: family 2A encapsulin nanocompartment cargo protein cysteine desulfurase [Kofleriaceae bacterium]